jgi:multidrug efflux pump
MKFTDIFIKRPVLATVVSLLILLMGLRAIGALNVRQFPDVKDSTVTVTVAYPGASADLIRGYITTPLERSIAASDGIDYLTSQSAPSSSTIVAKLRLNFDPNAAMTQITANVNKVRSQLPKDAQDPVITLSTGETTAAIYISFYSDSMTQSQITDYLTRVVQPKLSTVKGVQEADIIGARNFSMRIWLHPEKMAAQGLSGSQIRSILAAQNYLSAVGTTKGSMITVNLNAHTDLNDVKSFEDIVIKQSGSQVVRLKDVATVELGAEDYNTVVRMGNSDATFMAVFPLPTANVLDVVRGVKDVLPEIESRLPGGMKMRVPYDSTEFITDCINEVLKTLMEAMLIVIGVIYLFLGSVRSVIIPVVAIPLSLIGGVFLMLLMGFSINLLTLLAMVLAIGLVVDDAIVVVENIHRHIEEGLPPLEAALKGAGELIGPVIAMTITLMAVFAPIGFQTGLTGLLFREFAFTLAGAVLVSGIVALTLSPMMCSKFLRHTPPTGLAHRMDVLFEKLKEAYQKALHLALDHRGNVYAIAALFFIAIIPFYSCSKSELAPVEDRGAVINILQTQSNSTIEQTAFHSFKLLDAYGKHPLTRYAFAFAGRGGTNSAFVIWVLKPPGERSATSMDLVPYAFGEISKITGALGFATIPPSLPGSTVGAPVQFVVCSTEDPRRVAEVADEMVKKAQQSGLFTLVSYDSTGGLRFDQPESEILIERDAAALAGVNMQSLGDDLSWYMGGNYVNWFAIEGNSYKVIPQSTRLWRLNADQLNNIYVSTTRGSVIPLSSIARLTHSVVPRSYNHFQQLNSSTLIMQPRPGVSMGEALRFLSKASDEIFPKGFTADYSGQLRQYVQEGSSLIGTFLLAIIAIYLVLAALYESFKDPIVILMSVPLAITGTLIFIFLGVGGATINIYTQVGLIALVGLIAKNGILIVEFANKLHEEGRDLQSAVEEAASIRLRPILMTTFAAVLGVIPLLLARGPGAVSRFDMGLVVASGLSIGTLFTLFVVPAFYLLIKGGKQAKE